MSKNLVLTGMMGVGKSTIGKNLAQKLSYKFIDVDKVIESKEGCSINSIFKNKKESYFRKVESEVTLKVLNEKKAVISLGGGAFLNRSIRQAVKSSSMSFWIDISIEILIRRLKRSKKRPLLYKKKLDETVAKIYLQRKKTYNKANHRVKCDFLKPEEITSRILKLYENSRN